MRSVRRSHVSPLPLSLESWRPQATGHATTVEDGAPTTLSLRLPSGHWLLSLRYDSTRPCGSERRGGLDARLPANLDYRGVAPFWPAGEIESDGLTDRDHGLGRATFACRAVARRQFGRTPRGARREPKCSRGPRGAGGSASWDRHPPAERRREVGLRTAGRLDRTMSAAGRPTNARRGWTSASARRSSSSARCWRSSRRSRG